MRITVNRVDFCSMRFWGKMVISLISSGGYHESYQDISSAQEGRTFSGFGGEEKTGSKDGWDDWSDSGWSQESPARR